MTPQATVFLLAPFIFGILHGPNACPHSAVPLCTQVCCHTTTWMPFPSALKNRVSCPLTPLPFFCHPIPFQVALPRALSQRLFVKGWERAVSQSLGLMRQRPCCGADKQKGKGEEGFYPCLTELGGFARPQWEKRNRSIGPKEGIQTSDHSAKGEVYFL